MSLATRPKPAIDHWNRPFRDACKERRLTQQSCAETGKRFFPPAPVSPFTGKPDWSWVDAAGRGALWLFVGFHQTYFEGTKGELPYPAVMVKLDEGSYLLTNLEGMTADQLKIGMRMADRFADGPDGFELPQFGPAA